MKKFPIGLQLYSVREDMEKDYKGPLKKIKEMGYDGVEFAGLYGCTPKQMKEELDHLGLVPVSAHVPFVTPGFEKTIEGAKILGETAKKLGMQLLYHNHDFEFVKIDGIYALDILYQSVPEDLLKTELDTCWVNVGGENPSDYVRKYTGRAPIVHLKDFAGEKSDHMYELIGIEEEKKEEQQKFEFRPVGYGKQDFKAILKAAEDAKAKWVIVEQDQPSMGKTAMECAEMSICYLKELQD